MQKAWQQVQVNFRECPTCGQICCISDFDPKAGYCNDDSSGKNEIARAEAEQAANAIKGFADVFGLGDAIKGAMDAPKRAATQTARCPKDGTVAPVGTKFCTECGTAMVQPATDACPKCGAATAGAKFRPECGTKIERVAALTNCRNCGAELKGAKFCPECGTKAG